MTGIQDCLLSEDAFQEKEPGPGPAAKTKTGTGQGRLQALESSPFRYLSCVNPPGVTGKGGD